MKYIVLDTETAGSLSKPTPYDIGWAVVDELGNVYKTRSYIILEVFADDEMMDTAYYKEKCPRYLADVIHGTRKEVKMESAIRQLYKDMQTYGVSAICAHNMPFDHRATENGAQAFTSRKAMFPRYAELIDTLALAKEVFGKDADYIDFCQSNGFMTAHRTPRPRMTAEILYRYLTDDLDFVESHTGLEDVLIEKEILVECLRRMAE